MKIRLTCDFIKPLRLKIEKVYPENNTVDVIAGTAFRFNTVILSGTIQEFADQIGKDNVIEPDGKIIITSDKIKLPTTKRFQDYFLHSLDYPGDRLIIYPIEIGTDYNYVASSYLDGFINYGTLVKLFVVGRCRDWFEDFESDDRNTVMINDSKTGGYNWVEKFYKDKDELFNLVTQPNAVSNLCLSQHFQDDVVILKRLTNFSENQWIYFWYDMDSSDCSIGRFTTDDNDQTVIQKFTEFVKNSEANKFGEREIPLHCFNGWVRS